MRQALLLAALIALSLPAAAGADVLDTYQRLAERNLKPAPLVPTTVPRSVAPIERTISAGTTRGARGYSIRLVHYGPNGPDAIVVVTGGEFKRMRALLRDRRILGFRSRKATRVRGHRGYVLTRRLGPTTRELVWVERGVVYAIGSGTPKKVSLANLRATARGLDRLGRALIGGADDPDNSSEGFAATTARTVTLSVSFEASCAFTARVGQAQVTMMRRSGNTFAFDIAEHREGDEPWVGTVAGTIAGDAITLDIRASGTIAGEACDTGPLRLTLR